MFECRFGVRCRLSATLGVARCSATAAVWGAAFCAETSTTGGKPGGVVYFSLTLDSFRTSFVNAATDHAGVERVGVAIDAHIGLWGPYGSAWGRRA